MLNLRDAKAVREAFNGIKKSVTEKVGAEHFQGVTVQPMAKLDGYELILGASLDPQFGPVLLFGTGGQLVEVFKDKSLALPPLNSTLARRMMETTKIYHALKGVRGRKSVDMAALENLLVRFSELVVENPAHQGDRHQSACSPLRSVCWRWMPASCCTRPRCQMRSFRNPPSVPIPSSTSQNGRCKNGEEVVIRPIRPEDEPMMVDFHKELSERSVYLRYFQPLKFSQRTAHERLTRICFIDYNREMALVAERGPKRESRKSSPWGV